MLWVTVCLPSCLRSHNGSFGLMREETVEQVFFLATHRLDGVDWKLVQHYVADLKRLPSSRLWVLMLRDSRSPRDGSSVPAGAGLCEWSIETSIALFPRLRNSTREVERGTRAASHARSDRYFHLYFFLHTALAVWYRRYGEYYPRLKWFWRVEPDVILSSHGGWAGFLVRASSDSADLLLPHIEQELVGPPRTRSRLCFGIKRGHCFVRGSADERLLWGGPSQHRLWALVSVARYSKSFILSLMSTKWRKGVIGFEETFLPTSCRAAPSCTLSTFRRETSIHVRYRPQWECETLLVSDPRQPPQLPILWHPVKQRRCFVEYLDRRRLSPTLDELAHTVVSSPFLALEPSTTPFTKVKDSASHFMFYPHKSKFTRRST